MKTKLLLAVLIPFSFNFIFSQCPDPVPANYTCIPDSAFENALIVRGIDSEGGPTDGLVLTSDLNSASNIEVSGFGITDLTGIEQCTSLLYLNISNNSLSGSLDLNASTSLLSLSCINNSITAIDVTNCSILNAIYFENNDLMSLDLSNKGNLEQVIATNNSNLSSINLTDSNYLRVLKANSTSISSLDLSAKTNLQYLEISGSNLTSLTIGAAMNLYNINVSNNQLTVLDLSNCGQPATALPVVINCDDNLLTDLNLKNGDNLEIDTFSALNNNLSCITVDDATYSTSNWTNIDPGVSFSANCALGLKEFDKESILLYPNPSNSGVNVHLTDDATYALSNMFGQEIKNGVFITGENVLNIQNLSNGLYFLNIDSNEGHATKKIIKN